MRERGLWLDPRTKLWLLASCILASMAAPSLLYQLGLVLLIGVLACCFGKWRLGFLGVLCYLGTLGFTFWAMEALTGTVRMMFIAFLGLFHRVYACGMLSGLVISTTRVGEFLAAMARMHMPKGLVIPLAVLLRYLPVIREDWGYIRDAMKLRDISPSLAGLLIHPEMTVACLYVPLLTSASKAADELSVASVTRGIENPRPRTCLTQIGFSRADVLAAGAALGYLWLELGMRGGGA